MKTFKTKKGTELPLLDLRGKDYLQVAHRLVWFREDHPDWSITTELVEHSQAHAIAKATIANEKGFIVATGHKTETKQGFADFHEKAETGAVGRALAMVGYGTQFAPELDEGERLADTPLPRSQKQNNPRFDSVPAQNTPSYNERHDAKMAGPMTEKQRNMLKRLGDELGMNASERMDFLQDRGIDPNNISEQEASDCITELTRLNSAAPSQVKDFHPEAGAV